MRRDTRHTAAWIAGLVLTVLVVSAAAFLEHRERFSEFPRPEATWEVLKADVLIDTTSVQYPSGQVIIVLADLHRGGAVDGVADRLFQIQIENVPEIPFGFHEGVTIRNSGGRLELFQPRASDALVSFVVDPLVHRRTESLTVDAFGLSWSSVGGLMWRIDTSGLTPEQTAAIREECEPPENPSSNCGCFNAQGNSCSYDCPDDSGCSTGDCSGMVSCGWCKEDSPRACCRCIPHA